MPERHGYREKDTILNATFFQSLPYTEPHETETTRVHFLYNSTSRYKLADVQSSPNSLATAKEFDHQNLYRHEPGKDA